MSYKLTHIQARQVFDSRGNPTVEVEAHTSKYTARAIVPSGASTGSHEALELRDNKKQEFLGKGVSKAIWNVNHLIAPEIEGMDIRDQKAIDDTLIALDATENKSRLGANALLGVSLAIMKLSAQFLDLPLYTRIGEIAREQSYKTPPAVILPTPMMNIINGGKHADSGLAIQEFMIVPTGASSFSEAMQIGSEVFHHLKLLLKEKNLSTAVGDEGGFAPKLDSNKEALELIMEAARLAQHKDKIHIALDAAANEFYSDKQYLVDHKKLSSEQLIEYYAELTSTFPIISLEDGLAEDDWDGWTKLNKRLGDTIQIVGDDLFVTNVERIAQGIEKHAANAVLIKLNQIGTVTETLAAIGLAKENAMHCIISHRSGESEDTTIADFAVGVGCGQIKAGSLSRSERVAKYNQLLRIEEQLGERALYKGEKSLR